MSGTEVHRFVTELDDAMQAHLQWTGRVLRCVVLRASPGDDVLKPEAHVLCRLGSWFTANRREFEAMDPERAGALESDHKAMHDAVRSICLHVLQGRPAEAADLDRFERAQSEVIESLAQFKTLAVARDSFVDPLTGLPLRHHMQHDYDLLRRQIGRYANALLVLMVDVDLFKDFNDRHGHAGGDIVLQALAQALRYAIRKNDQVYRYGGEEFLMLLSLAERAHAEPTIEKLLNTVRALSITLPDGAVVRVTVTMGAALAGSTESLATVIDRADHALYAGKAAGRNCYQLAPMCRPRAGA
jgi:diguanylate cyclase